MRNHKDPHSYANADAVRPSAVRLDLEVLFDRRRIEGVVTHTLADHQSSELILDTRDLAIAAAESSFDGENWRPAPIELGPADAILGAPLRIAIEPGAPYVRIAYSTAPEASGLQWLDPPQTAGGRHPFLYTQSQSIHARSWIPIQDSPGVRVTYTARVRVPHPLVAVMGAEAEGSADGVYSFRMPQPIPPYLIALAAGDLAFRETGPRTGVWSEPAVVDRAARELEDMEKMMQAVEAMYGPYRWGRYDVLICPPSFPIGGMENPRLTFATPTILTGDKSLVSLIAHELAHSWSGNLVTNATWNDFWLNEGFTVYLERRIQEAVYGRERAEMEAVIELDELKLEMARLAERDQILNIDLDGRDPDDGFTLVPYIKGALLLRLFERAYGRNRFDAFLRAYFEHFAFRSVTTAEFLAFLHQHLIGPDPGAVEHIDIDDWVYNPGLPAGAPKPVSTALERVQGYAGQWMRGERERAGLPAQNWCTHEWLHFLRSIDGNLGAARMAKLDEAFRLTETGNCEILAQWLLLAVRNGYTPANARLEEFLMTVGRRKFIKPLYEELVKSPEGKQRAREIYARARPRYHPISAAAIDTVIGPPL